MTSQQRSLLAGGLSFVVLIGWYFFIGPEVTPPPPTPAVVSSSPVITTPSSETVGTTVSTPQAPKADAVAEKITETETALYRIQWTNRDARPAKIFLKGFKETVVKTSPSISFLTFEGEKALPLRCEGCNKTLPPENAYVEVEQANDTITYEAASDGVIVRKTYQWSRDQYLLHLKISLQNKADQEFHGRLGIEWKARQLPQAEKQGLLDRLKGPPNQRHFFYKVGPEVVHDEKMEEPREIKGLVAWAGIEDRYFLTSLISRRVSSEQVLRYHISGDHLHLSLMDGEKVIPPGGIQEENYSLYVGPKDRDALMAAGVELERAVDYGWFSFLAIPILKLLQFFQRFVGNWGIAIIVLTIFVKVLMNPLSIKSMKQMKEMQKLQPKLQALKEKYANDKQRLNMETMQLFKSHGVNPMGGCFPMLLQMPIYIALYKVLYNSIEIYHAPFFGFYRDLSAPDPYFILPALLGVFMFLQQKMTPSATTDPVQKQMMTIMPVMFTAFMLFLPLGLVIYILVNTVMGVAQQWMSQKDIRWRDIPKLLSKSSA